MDDTKRQLEPLRTKGNPVVIGTGLVALDVVISSGLETDPQLRAGGTCGNVLTVLAYLGWDSYPIARLSEDGASKLVAADLRQWGVRLDFVTFDDDGSTPVIVQHIRNSKTGAPSHSFSRKCPCCGAILPWYKALRVADVTDLVPKLPKPQVYFFDRVSRAALALAKQARKQGAVVFFEPSASSEPTLLEEALQVAHIVKLSSDRIAGNEAVLASTQPKVVIETQGSAGLRLRNADCEGERRLRKWHKMDSIPAGTLKDTAGAGDWCTAGIIHMIGALGAKGLDTLTPTDIRKAVKVGQAMASWACGFDGPRGGMYYCDRATFEREVIGLLHGRTESSMESKKAAVLASERPAFACEACREKGRP
jgi:sugar/nucleoside kinase (ribokinase family)